MNPSTNNTTTPADEGGSGTMQTLDTAEVAAALGDPSTTTIRNNYNSTISDNKVQAASGADNGALPKLPAKWAVEMRRASSTTGSSKEHENAGVKLMKRESRNNKIEDHRLNDFLASFQEEVIAARNLKAVMDSSRNPKTREQYKAQLREHMRRIRTLFATEGDDFIEAIDARNPGLAQARGCEASTLEIAKGIEKLEEAMAIEDRRRVAGVLRTLAKVRNPGDGAGAVGGKRVVVNDKGAGSGNANGGVTMVVSHSEETLCLMQSNLQALKLELIKLQRSNNNNNPARNNEGIVITEEPNSSSSPVITDEKVEGPGSEGDTTTVSSSINGTQSQGEPPNSTGGGNMNGKHPPAPGYVHHLEQMKSRLEALQKKKPVVRPRRKSGTRRQLVRSATFSSLNICVDENQGPTQAPQTLPPITREQFHAHAQAYRESQNGSKKAESKTLNKNGDSTLRSRNLSVAKCKTIKIPKTPPPARRIPASNGVGSLPASPGSPASSESLSPVLHKSGLPRGPRSHAMSIDAPEELLSRPQSQAAAVDMQRYSLKIAKRFTAARPLIMSTGRERPAPVGRALSELTPSNLAALKSLAALNNVEPGKGASVGSAISGKEDVKKEAPFRGKDQADRKKGDAVEVGAQKAAESIALEHFDANNEQASMVVEEKESNLWVRKGLLWKRWRRRFASIVSHEFFGRVLCLFSYNSAGAVISTRSQMIVLGQAVVRPLRDAIEHSTGLRYGFVLQTSSKEYYLAAQDAATRGAWVKELRRAAGKPATAALRASISLHERLSTSKGRASNSKLMSSSSRRLLGRRK